MENKSKRIIVIICLEMLLIFGNVEPAGAKDNWFLLGAERFTAPILRLGQSNIGYYDSRPAMGASGQNPAGGGSGENQNPSSGSDAGSCSPIPGTLVDGELARLAHPSLYRERLETFRNKEVLPDAYVEQYGRDLRFHALDPDTKIIEGTLGANRETNGGPPKIEGYHLYNDKTGFNSFFDRNGKQYRTGFETNRRQRIDIKTNGNII